MQLTASSGLKVHVVQNQHLIGKENNKKATLTFLWLYYVWSQTKQFARIAPFNCRQPCEVGVCTPTHTPRKVKVQHISTFAKVPKREVAEVGSESRSLRFHIHATAFWKNLNAGKGLPQGGPLLEVLALQPFASVSLCFWPIRTGSGRDVRTGQWV